IVRAPHAAHAALGDRHDQLETIREHFVSNGEGVKAAERLVVDERHGSIPNRSRASFRNSSSVAVSSRSLSTTNRRKSPRAAKSQFVTSVVETPSSAATSPYVGRCAPSASST